MEIRGLLSLDHSTLSEEVIDILLFDSSTEPSLFDEIAKNNLHRPNILRFLLNHPLTPSSTRQFVSEQLRLPMPSEREIKSARTDESTKAKVIGLLQKIQKLSTGEKIQLAFRGSKDIRTILLRDPSKEVMLAVLENPKITNSEIEVLAKQQTTPLEIIRTISQKRDWMRTYSIIHSLISNPKTPVDISLKHIHHLRDKDLSMLEKNRNIPEAVRSTAKRLLTARRK
ncbi:MAG: hypothetical protein Fur0020_01660 [Thermodesulfovibrionia bacterium]